MCQRNENVACFFGKFPIHMRARRARAIVNPAHRIPDPK